MKPLTTITVHQTVRLTLGLFWVLCALAAVPVVAHAQSAKSAPLVLNFNEADIESVARALATLTGKHVVVDPRVKGTMTLNSDKPVSPAVALDQFASNLRMQGFALVQTAHLYKVVPEADAKLQNGDVYTQSPSTLGKKGVLPNQIVTQIFLLRHENANNLVPVLRPLMAPNSIINVNAGNNSLILTDYADNLQRMEQIVNALDVSPGTQIEVVAVQHTSALDLAPMLVRMLEGGNGNSGAPRATTPDGSFPTTVLADSRTNTLLVRAANSARLALAKSLIQKLDQPSNGQLSGNIHVIHLKNADAVQLATTLRAAMAGEGGGSGAGTAAGSAAPAATMPKRLSTNTANAPGGAGSMGSDNAVSTGGQVQADPATNSLIITASEPQYRQLRAVIDMLDTRRAQVFVESLIVEVNAEKAAQFGIQWQGPTNSTGSKMVGVLGTNFGSGGSNLLSLATQTVAGLPGNGLNLGLVRNFGGTSVLLGLANMIERNGDGNVLSTPNLLTLDNEEAKIIVGQNVPFLTGQFSNTGGGNAGAVNPFQTIERKDVGLTLKVKPQISENGTIKMSLFQEVSSVDKSSISNASGPTTNKRSIESNVLVEDGQIVVLGGLLQDEFSDNADQVPWLGDLPVIGRLFKNQNRTRKKTNLMVFLRPVVMRDAQQTESLSQSRYDMIRGLQQQHQPQEDVILGVNEAPVAPAYVRNHLRISTQLQGMPASAAPVNP